MVRPTARGVGLFLVACATYIAARTLGTWELYLLSFAFLGALLVSWLLALLSGRKLAATRTATPERPVAGDALTLSFVVTNRSLLPGLQVTLRQATGDLGAPDREIHVESLGWRAERVVTTEPLPARRGVHRLPAMLADAGDPLGLMHVRRRLGEPLELVVYPRLVELPSCALVADTGRRRERGRRGLPTLGGSEFRSVRPHHPGEPLNHVDWKSTAKTGVLMLREMDDTGGGDITLLLDGAAAHVVGEPPETSFELAVRAAGSVAGFALRAGRPVTLLLHENDWRPARLSPDTNGHHRLLESLARVTPHTASQLGRSLKALLAGVGSAARAQTLTLVVLALDRPLAHSLIELRHEGLQVSVIHVASASFGSGVSAASAGPTPEDRALLLSLAAAGIRCLTLSRHDDLRASLSLWRSDDLRAVSR